MRHVSPGTANSAGANAQVAQPHPQSKRAGARARDHALCAVKGCPWRGQCPVHSRQYPKGYSATAGMMRHRHNDAPQAKPLDRDAARALDWRIRLAADAKDTSLYALIDEARRRRVHKPLGFRSWEAYVDSVSRTAAVSKAVSA